MSKNSFTAVDVNNYEIGHNRTVEVKISLKCRSVGIYAKQSKNSDIIHKYC